MYPSIRSAVEEALHTPPPPARQQILQPLIDYIQEKVDRDAPVYLIFICTHNSRRSQFAQVWAHLGAVWFDLPIQAFSAGTEVTACNERTLASLDRTGFQIETGKGPNPVSLLRFAEDQSPIQTYSKTYDEPARTISQFAAVMTCADAEENCPFIPGAEKRISLTYEDPKVADDSPLEAATYDARSRQIASELFFVLSKINYTR
jgi:arsenate reductase